MEQGLRAGLTHRDLWELTPREISLSIRAYGKQLHDALEISVIGAWRNAVWSKSDRIPDLDKVLNPPHKGRLADKKFTEAETRRWIKALAEAAGKPSN